MNKAAVAMACVLLFVVVGIAIFLTKQGDQPSLSPRELGARSMATTSGPDLQSTNVLPSTPPARTAVAKPSYLAMLKSSKSYLEFARATLEPANAGDPEAQYALGKALKFCADFHGSFAKNDKLLTMKEATERAISLGRSTSALQSIYDRCHELYALNHEDFGQPLDWISKAANNGQLAAQAIIAVASLSRSARETPSSDFTADSTVGGGRDTEPTALLLAAIERGEPEALWNAGRAKAILTEDYDDKLINQWAWWLVSCQRGMDCSATADWIQLDCTSARDCPAQTTGIEYIQNASNENWLVVQQRAQEINDSLATGQWKNLGFGK